MKMLLFILVFHLLAYKCLSQKSNATETTIRSLEQKVVQAILDADTNTLKELWAPEFLVNTPRNNIAGDREAVFQNQRLGLINYSSFDRVIESIQIKKNVVITMGAETFISRTDIPDVKAGQPVKRRFTNIWMKKNGKWQQTGRHASIICS